MGTIEIYKLGNESLVVFLWLNSAIPCGRSKGHNMWSVFFAGDDWPIYSLVFSGLEFNPSVNLMVTIHTKCNPSHGGGLEFDCFGNASCYCQNILDAIGGIAIEPSTSRVFVLQNAPSRILEIAGLGSASIFYDGSNTGPEPANVNDPTFGPDSYLYHGESNLL